MRFSNAGVTLRDDAMYFGGGFDGEIDLGSGSDTLILDLSVADLQEKELRVRGDGFWGSPGDHDVLVLQHLTAESDMNVTFDAYGGVSISHFNQTIGIHGVEEIWLGDGTDLFAFA